MKKALSPFWTTIGINFFRAVRALKKGLEFFFVKIVWRMLYPLGWVVFRLLILPAYRLVVLTKLRIQHLALPARGFVLFFVTNRYSFHVVIIAASLATLWVNLQTQQVLAQDIGKGSLLYSLMTEGESEIVTEQIASQDVKPSESRFGQGTIEAVPHIDFDYRTAEEEFDRNLSFTIPGTISLVPIDHTDGEVQHIRPRRQGVESYVVKAGDTLGSIARDYSVNVGTILWTNNLTERQYIRPGDTLKILPVSGVLVKVRQNDTLTTLAKRYNGEVDEIISQNNLIEDQLKIGTELVIPGGEPSQIVQTRIMALDNRRYPAVTSERLSEPGARRERGDALEANNPTPKPADATEKPEMPKTRLLWPTSGHIITQYYGWYHVGVDVDGDFTSPLYAADDGVVTTAAWNKGGYGLMVLIDHPNGMRTRYGHASKLFVKVGDAVHRGQVIAMMGSTGRSTGSHLHFEVYVNGRRVNPLIYIR